MSNEEAILVVDDDLAFCQVLARALARRGYSVTCCHNIAQAEATCQQQTFAKAVVDLKIAQESGLKLLSCLKSINPALKIVMLTGYSSVSTAVEAIKLGAINYVCKPIEVADLLKAFEDEPPQTDEAADFAPPSLDRIEWEHIQKILLEHQGNISAAARAMGMHRRTLQRKLNKRPTAR